MGRRWLTGCALLGTLAVTATLAHAEAPVPKDSRTVVDARPIDPPWKHLRKAAGWVFYESDRGKDDAFPYLVAMTEEGKSAGTAVHVRSGNVETFLSAGCKSVDAARELVLFFVPGFVVPDDAPGKRLLAVFEKHAKTARYYKPTIAKRPKHWAPQVTAIEPANAGTEVFLWRVVVHALEIHEQVRLVRYTGRVNAKGVLSLVGEVQVGIPHLNAETVRTLQVPRPTTEQRRRRREAQRLLAALPAALLPAPSLHAFWVLARHAEIIAGPRFGFGLGWKPKDYKLPRSTRWARGIWTLEDGTDVIVYEEQHTTAWVHWLGPEDAPSKPATKHWVLYRRDAP